MLTLPFVSFEKHCTTAFTYISHAFVFLRFSDVFRGYTKGTLAKIQAKVAIIETSLSYLYEKKKHFYVKNERKKDKKQNRNDT